MASVGDVPNISGKIMSIRPWHRFVLLTVHFQGKNRQFKANIRPFIDAFLHDTRDLTWSDPIAFVPFIDAFLHDTKCLPWSDPIASSLQVTPSQNS